MVHKQVNAVSKLVVIYYNDHESWFNYKPKNATYWQNKSHLCEKSDIAEQI